MPKEANSQIERPPVISVMGHIDHGKSTLLDHIRQSNVVDTEAGGITQHVSAYEVEHLPAQAGEREGTTKRITFLDTPGHEAFRAMRSRGARVADIAILVVAADDGVKPQTLEALEAIKEADIPYVVAINKTDKPDADVQKTLNNLVENEIYLEGYGGDIPYVGLSAKTGENIDELLDVILLVAELQELKGDPDVPGTGVVVESNIDPKKGISATLIIKNGTVSSGQYVVAGESIAPIRIMEDFTGDSIKKAVFSSPIRITGFDTIPEVGASFNIFPKRKEAEAFLEEKSSGAKKEKHDVRDEHEEHVVVPLVIKADVSGTLEAVIEEVKKVETEHVSFNIVATGLGSISENDVRLGGEKSLIIAFNVSIDGSSEELAKRLEADMGTFTIIYELVDWLKEAVEKRKPHVTREEITGKMKVLRTFSKKRDRQIIGGRVQEGTLAVKNTFNIRRRDEVIGTGTVVGLQSQKVQTTEVGEKQECGADVESKIELAPGDILEAITVVNV